MVQSHLFPKIQIELVLEESNFTQFVEPCLSYQCYFEQPHILHSPRLNEMMYLTLDSLQESVYHGHFLFQSESLADHLLCALHYPRQL